MSVALDPGTVQRLVAGDAADIYCQLWVFMSFFKWMLLSMLIS